MVGCGGEGDEEGSSIASTYGSWWREFMESAVDVADPKLRQDVDAAIFSHMLAALEHEVLEIVILKMRIFFNSEAGSRACTTPSGFVPSSGRSGCVQFLFFSSGTQGLDCFLAICFRVFYAKTMGHVVFYFIFKGLDVIVHPPLNG
jgi:hypothetical protein